MHQALDVRELENDRLNRKRENIKVYTADKIKAKERVN